LKHTRLYLVFLILCLTPLLNGCRIVIMDDTTDELFKLNSDKELILETNVHVYRNKLLIRGESTLPAGAKVEFLLKPYHDDLPVLKLENYAVEPKDETIESGTTEVGKDGNLDSLFISRPDETKRYRLEVVFDPRKQGKEIQKKYGAAGESLPSIEGKITVTGKSGKVAMIQKVININKLGEPNGLMARLRLASLKELRKANFAEKLELTAVK
jgi:hypothetical protein